jgi:hypothetical protein
LVLVRILLIKDAYSNGLVEGGDRVFEYCLGQEYVSAVSSLGTGVGILSVTYTGKHTQVF